MQASLPPSLNALDLACRRGDRLLFRGLSLELRAGDVCHVTGANGAGKSSLLRILAGLLNPFAGSVAATGAIGLLDERAALDEDLPLGRALDFWRRVDGAPDTAKLPGANHLLDIPVRYLSTGQTKRAMLARLDAQSAPIWLLDEPLNGLDTAATKDVCAMVDAHRRAGGICVLASHLAFPLEDMKTLALEDFAP